MPYDVQYVIRGVGALKTGEVSQAVRNAMEAMGKFWRRNFLAKRFTHEGARELGFKRRKGETGSGGSGRPRPKTYTWKKWKLFGHTLPNVYSGELKRLSLYGPMIVKATHAGANAMVRIRLPRKASFRMADMQSTSQRELDAMSAFLSKQLERELSRMGAQASAVVMVSLQ